MENELPLHSNMFLLIPIKGHTNNPRGKDFTFQYVSINTSVQQLGEALLTVFTFQYVSINTRQIVLASHDVPTLHSNMFLLIQFGVLPKKWRFLPLHSNMFLLILYPVRRHHISV